MKFTSVLLLVVVAAVTLADNTPPYELEDAPQLFEKFIKDYNRHYKDDHDKQIHYEEFKKYLLYINKRNAEEPLAHFAIDDFADKTPQEKEKYFGLKLPPQ